MLKKSLEEIIYDLLATTDEGIESEVIEEDVGADEAGTETESEDLGEQTEVPTYEIDGEKYTAEQIREWKQGNMRQSDYTRKTQEVAQSRKEAQEALELMNYLKSKPELAQKLYDLDSNIDTNVKQVVDKVSDKSSDRLEKLEMQFRVNDIERDLNMILSKDKDVTDVELLEIATKESVDIRKAYSIWKGENFDQILQKRLDEQSKNFAKNIQKNANTTKTLITPTDKITTTGDFGLTQQELAFAVKMDMSAEEYAKYKK